MSREINPEKLSNGRSMRNGESVPIPPFRLSQLPLPQPHHRVQILVSEQPPAQPKLQPKLSDRRKVKVLIANQKPFRQRPPRQAMTKVPPQQTGSWKVNLLVTTLILSAIVGVGGSGFLAAQFIFNPGSLSWIPGNKLLGLGHPAQTLKEIQAEAYKAGAFASSPLYVSTYPGFKKEALGQDDLLLPIYASPMLEKLIELRVYRQTQLAEKTVFELKDRIAIEGPAEAEAIAPLTASSKLIQGSDRPLALTEVEFLEGKAPASGVWLQLSGEWARSGTQIAYGRVLHYDPLRASFHTLLTWISPAGELPRWQQITGDTQTELLVNQTVGLAPHFQVYQMKPRQSMTDAVQLEAIALTKPVLKGRTYEDALLFAQNGLWASAQGQLEAVKQSNTWSNTAQGQLDLVKLHAQATKAQADKTWASPTQQILALLMDGRWAKALSQLKTAHQNGYDIINFLHANVEYFLPQVEVSLTITPGEADILRWGTLMKAIQTNNRDAVTWLRKHQAPADIQQVLALLNLPLNNISIIHNENQPQPALESSIKIVERKRDPSSLPSVPSRLSPESPDLISPAISPQPTASAPTQIQAPTPNLPPSAEPSSEPENLPEEPEISGEEIQPLIDPIDPKY